MVTPGSDATQPIAQPVAPAAPFPAAPPPKKRSGCLIAFLIVAVGFVICAGIVGAGVWYWWNQSTGGGGGAVGQCFPAATDGPLDLEHGTVPCSHPNAL